MYQTMGKAYEHKGGIVIKTTRPPAGSLSDDVVCLWCDHRQISPEQRRKAWALIGEIASACGYLSAADKSQINNDLKREFLIKRMDELTKEAIKRFSLSDTDMTTARLYITFLVDFIIEHEIPTKQPLIELADDVESYLYGCLLYKRCAVCGRPADLHHVDRVGMGRNRESIHHLGLRAQSLCRMHHQQVDAIGQAAFDQRYHIFGIPLDETLCKAHKLTL